MGRAAIQHNCICQKIETIAISYHEYHKLQINDYVAYRRVRLLGAYCLLSTHTVLVLDTRLLSAYIL